MSDDIFKVLLGDSEPTPVKESKNPVTDQFITDDIKRSEQEYRDSAQFVDLTGQTDYGPPTIVYGAGDYFSKGVEAGVEQVVGSFYGMGAIADLITGDEEGAQTNLNEMARRDQNLQAILAPLETFPDFLDNPSFGDAFNQAARGVGQFIAPAALTIAEALAGGITVGVAQTAFTSAGRAALKDILADTTRKFATFKRGRNIENLPDNPIDPTVPLLPPPGNIFKEMWYKTARNKGVDNLTAAEKVLMDGSRNFLRNIKRGAGAGAFISSETMLAPEVLREYQEAGMQLTSEEALAALVVGAPAAAIDVLGEAVFLGSMFKVAAGKTRLAATKRKAALGYPLSNQDKQALALAALAEKKGLDAIGEVGKRYLRKYENPAKLSLLGDITRAALASAGVEGATEALQEEIIMSQATLKNPDFNAQSVEANLRRGQAFFDGFVAGGGRGVLGGVSSGIFRQARDFYLQAKEDAQYGFLKNKTVRDLEKLGGLPEVREDIIAQLGTMVDTNHKRTSLWLSEETLKSLDLIDENTTLLELLNTGGFDLSALQDFLRNAYNKLGIPESSVPAISISLDKDGFGVLLTVDPAIQKKYSKERMEDRPLRDVLQEILDFTETPTASKGDEVVVSLLENERVVWEQTTPNELQQIERAVEKADSQVKGGVLKPEDQLELDFGSDPGEVIVTTPISQSEKDKLDMFSDVEEFPKLKTKVQSILEKYDDGVASESFVKLQKELNKFADLKKYPKLKTKVQSIIDKYKDDPNIVKINEELNKFADLDKYPKLKTKVQSILEKYDDGVASQSFTQLQEALNKFADLDKYPKLKTRAQSILEKSTTLTEVKDKFNKLFDTEEQPAVETKAESSRTAEDFSVLSREELEEAILDSLDEEDGQRTESLLEEYAKRKKDPKREIIIQTVEEVANYRLENNPKTDDDDGIIKKISEELGRSPEEVLQELKDLESEATEEGIVDVDGGKGYEVAGTDQAIDAEIIENAANIQQVGVSKLLSGRYAQAFKKADLTKIPEEGLDEIRKLQADIMSLTVAAELSYTSVFTSGDATKEMERLNGLIAEKNEYLEQLVEKHEKYQQNEPAIALKQLRKRIQKGYERQRSGPTARTVDIGEGTDPVKVRIKPKRNPSAKDVQTALNALPPKDLTLIRINETALARIRKQIKATQDELIKLIEENKKNMETASKTAGSPTPPTQSEVEALFLGELGATAAETKNLVEGLSSEFFARVNELLAEQEVRITSGDTQYILDRDIMEQLRSAVLSEQRNLEPIFLDRADQDLKKTLDRIDKKTKGERTLTAGGLDDVKDQLEKKAIKEARQQAIESVLAKAELYGVPLKSFGISGGATISSHLANYMDGAEVSLIDPELIQANAAILKRLLEAQKADPSSLFKLKTTDIIIGERSKETLFNPVESPRDIALQMFRLSPEIADKIIELGYSFQEVENLLGALQSIVKIQGGKSMVVPLIGLQNRLGKAQANRVVEFVRDIGVLMGLRLESNYQVIVKELTPESLPELYNDTFRDMTPEEAVQTAVTQGMQTAQNNAKNNPENFKDAEKYKGDGGSMRFMWVKRTSKGENVISFNEVLKAGVALFDSSIDSLERANLSYGYKVAMGFAKLLSNKFLTNFKDKNGVPAKIVFKYSYKQGKKYKTDEIALESLVQSLTIDDKLVKKSTKLPFFNSDVIGRMEDGAYVHDLDSIINRLAGYKYGSVKSKNYFINKNGKKELFEGAAPDLFSLPIYYNSSSGQYQSARELAETITETPFYKENKLSKPSLVNSIISLENSIVNPTFEVVRDKLQGIQESYNSLAELKQEVIDRHRENYRLHGYDEDFVDSLTDYRLDLNKLELTEITSGLQDGVDYWGYKLGSKLGYKVLGLAASEAEGFGDAQVIIPKTEFGKQILLLSDEAKTNPQQFKDLALAEKELQDLIFKKVQKEGVTAGFLDEPLSYAKRTELVVRYSDGVVIFSQTEPGTNKVNTPGSALTIRLAEQYNKPLLINPTSKEEILSFLMRHNIKRLNIAGAGASEPAYLANNPEYRTIIEGALADAKDLMSGDATSVLRQKALEAPEIYRFPTLEEQYAHLQAIAQENNILTENDYARISDDLDDLSREEFQEKIVDSDQYAGVFKDDQYEVPYFTKKPAKGYRKFNQSINNKTQGKVTDTETPGVYINDDVSEAFNLMSLGEEERATITNLLNLRIRDRDPKDTLSPDERAALRDLEKTANSIFGPDLNTVYQTRREVAQDLNLDLGKTTYSNVFKEVSDIAASVLKLHKKRKIFVMFENNPIVFEDYVINKFIKKIIEGDGKKLRPFAEDIGNPERITTNFRGIDIVILKNPELYTAAINKEIAKRNLGKQITLQEVEAVTLAGYFHSFGHIFFDEHIKSELDIKEGKGKDLLEEFEKVLDNPAVPFQYKQKGAFEEFISDQAGRAGLGRMATFDRRITAVKTASPKTRAFVVNLQKTLRKYYNTTKVQFAKDILGRVAGEPSDVINLFLNEASVTKNPENYRGGLHEIAKRRIELAKDVKKMSSDAFEKAYKDVSSKEFQETMDKLADFFKKAVMSNIDYLPTQNVDPAFVQMLYRQTQQKGDLGFIQAKDDLFNQILNELIEPLAKLKGLTIGGFFDDNEIGLQARTEISASLKNFSRHIISFGDKEFLKQIKDPTYVGKDNRRIPEESLLIYDVINRRLGKLMSQADIAKMPNFDLSRNLDTDKLSFDESVRNKVIQLIIFHNKDKKISRARAEREVDNIIFQGESDLFVNKDEEEVHEMVASVAVGSSPARSELFRKIPTADLDRAGALKDRITSQIHSIRSLTAKIVYNRKVVNVITDAHIKRARDLINKKEFTTPSGVVEDMSFLRYFAALDTRAEQKAKVKKSAGELAYDESIYNVRGWKASVSFIWLDPKVKDPIATSTATAAILGRAGMSINNMPNLRNIQSGLALLNQVTFLTFSALSTIPEFAGPMIQRGDLEGMAMTFRATMKNFQNTEEANNMLRAVGLMGISQSVEASIYAGDLGWATTTTQNLSKFFFKSIFITKMMNFLSRNSGIVAYMAIESDAKRGLKGDAQAIERLSLLNLTPQDAMYAINKINFLDENNPKSMSEYSKLFRTDNRTVKLRQGISILSKEMMLKPNSAQRTIWMNNPFFALLSQLKPFYYSYGKVFISNVINNVRRKYKYDGPVSALLPIIILVAMMLPLAALGLELREFLKYVLKGGDPEVFRSDEMTLPAYTLELIDRSGITGQAGLLIPTFEAELYGDAFFTPLLGPTAERGFDIMEGEGNVWDYVPYGAAVGYD